MAGPGRDFTIRRSPRARHARLTVTREGEAVVTLPTRAPERLAAELVEARRPWLERHRARALAEAARLAARPLLGDGRGLQLGGVEHRVVVEVAPGRRRSRVVHDDTELPTVRLLLAPGDERSVAAVLEPWLRAEARAAIGRRVAARAPQLGVEPAGISVRDQRSRWGSASRRGGVSFSWRLLLAPAAVLDYVVVHELAHLRVFGHGPRFWALVRSLVPEAERARRWLREHQSDLRAALT
ncbi:MAG TPA: SprT family zinc-dependent metalloprotease [Candidatus Limnocylindrales bacterium]|nr:SprT family zinc-dependent metalloprotease [Candidatus Limnocylindrales bacterium]